jgi:hypothetical protein
MSQIHFEIFRQHGKSGGWSLVEAMENRDAAVTRAKIMMDDGQATAVRVVKETFQESTGDYMSLTIFEAGHTEVNKKKNAKVEEIQTFTPCFKADDLYSYHARMTMSRALGEWLARQKLTVTELIHSAAALERFEATGTTYQHAIQKVAVAQAADSESSVSQIVKQLNDLCTSAINRVYKDERRKLFPELQAGQFGPLATKLGASPEGRYIINGALAKYIASVKTWDAKLQHLLVLMQDLPAEGPGRVLLLTAIDTLIAEMLNGSAALGDLLGHNPDLGHALLNLVELFLGTVVTAEGASGGINELARYFAKDELPEARAGIAGRILAELKGMKRLCPSSLDEEFKMLRRLGNQLVRGQGKYLSNEDLIGAFTERSRRLVTQEPLTQFMQVGKTSDEKLERLLLVEENIVGAENKRTLSTFMMPIITSNTFEEQLCITAPVQQRLHRVAELQQRVLRCGFQDLQKNQIAVALDAVAMRIEARGRLLASIEARITNPVERAQTLLKLCMGGMFTQGDLMMKAKRLMMASLAKPGFLTAYVAQLERERHVKIGRDQALAEFSAQLESVGITPEDTKRVIAA